MQSLEKTRLFLLPRRARTTFLHRDRANPRLKLPKSKLDGGAESTYNRGLPSKRRSAPASEEERGKVVIRIARLAILTAVTLISYAWALPADAAEPTNSKLFTVGRYLELQSAASPKVSPDGTQVVYTRSLIDVHGDKPETAIWIVGIDGRNHRFLAKGSGAVWSPDSKSIAYTGEGEPKGRQIFVLHLSVPGPATQITRVEHDPSNLHWSPDGKQIGFVMVVPASKNGRSICRPRPRVQNGPRRRATRRDFISAATV